MEVKIVTFVVKGSAQLTVKELTKLSRHMPVLGSSNNSKHSEFDVGNPRTEMETSVAKVKYTSHQCNTRHMNTNMYLR